MKQSALLLVLLTALPFAARAENTIPELFAQAGAGNAQAVQALQVRAEAGEPAAQRAMATLYMKGQGVPKDYRQAVAWLKQAAAKHDRYAQFYLGTLYQHALGVAADPAQAAYWYMAAAEQGMAQAQLNLAVVYEQQGFYTPAAKWYQEAAAQGQVDAAVALGRLYASGQGVGRSYPESCKWYVQAAESGYGGTAAQVGDCYAQGLGVVRDDAKAALWYQKAADTGDLASLVHLGDCYALGRGVARDEAQALTLYQEAAQGNPDTLMDVSLGYLGDDVLKADYSDASIWAGVVRARAHNGDLRHLAEKTEKGARQHLSEDEREQVTGRVQKILSGERSTAPAPSTAAPDLLEGFTP